MGDANGCYSGLPAQRGGGGEIVFFVPTPTQVYDLPELMRKKSRERGKFGSFIETGSVSCKFLLKFS